MNYLLGTSYYPATRYDASLFARVWIENVIRNPRPRPLERVNFSHGDDRIALGGDSTEYNHQSLYEALSRHWSN
jgi:Rieske Fe-S protein